MNNFKKLAYNIDVDLILLKQVIYLNCNILNVGSTIYRHQPLDHDDYIDVLFLYWVKDPTAYEHDDFLWILGVSQLLMIYAYICFVLGVDPEAHDR